MSNADGARKVAIFDQYHTFVSERIQDMAIVIMEDEQELVCDLSNGVSSNDLE